MFIDINYIPAITGYMCFCQSCGTGQDNDLFYLKLGEEYLLVSIKSCNFILKYEHEQLQSQKWWRP